jgi:hypothetical protein
MKLTPAPSPKGTNHERLYLDGGRLVRRGMAFDAASVAHDDDDQPPFGKLRAWLDRAGLNGDRELQEILDELEREITAGGEESTTGGEESGDDNLGPRGGSMGPRGADRFTRRSPTMDSIELVCPGLARIQVW